MKITEAKDRIAESIGAHGHLRAAGRGIVVVGALLSVNLIWEQTFLTWQRGPQMVGHSLGPLLLAIPGLWLWVFFLIGSMVVDVVRRRRIARSAKIDLAAAGVVFLLLAVPYEFWQTAFADRLAHGPYADECLVYGAAEGWLSTVKALIQHGTPVAIAERHMGRTALHAAAGANQVEIVKYLIAQGAPLDALDRSGDSPLEEALSRGSTAAATILESHGAHRIRGTETQHRQAIEDSVREDVEEYHRREKRMHK